MTPDVQQALAFLEQVCALSALPLAQHIEVKRAVKVVQDALTPPSSPPLRVVDDGGVADEGDGA